MVLFAMPSDGIGRFGVTASRRVGHAVARSRCKRRLRELYRTKAPSHVIGPVDLVVNARRSVADASWRSLVMDFETCLDRLEERLTKRQR
jgi:ribonuclease P protein component